MPFLVEPEPPRGEAHRVADGVLRLVARNPSSMTYRGTNTYLVPDGADFIVLDPGPATDQVHVDDIIRATGGRICAILVSHGHADHFGAVARLNELHRAPVHAFHRPIASDVVPDIALHHGDRVGPLQALHTPGHAADHLCFAREDGLVFTADHVMGWSSSVVSPPNGDMRAYLASLDFLIERDDPLYLPGHGPAIRNPRPYLEDLKARRVLREEEIFRVVEREAVTTKHLSHMLYAKVDPFLQAAAERNVLAHLMKMRDEGMVAEDGGRWFVLD